MSIHFIPECLKKQVGWILWKLIPQETGKPIKMPIKFDGSSSGWNTTRYTFNECLANLTEEHAGFGLQPLDGFGCLDVDDCIKNGEPNEFAKELLQFIDKTYVEYSPSGRGIHIWFKHDTNYTSMANFSPGKQIELFVNSKYVTMTGKVMVNAKIKKINLKAIVKKYFPKQCKRNLVEDPYKKKGLIGAFNRTVNIHEALAMTGMYEQVDATRYKYIPANSPGGGLVYEDKYFQSNHASDPLFGGMHNAFDVVRIHKFKKNIKDMLEFCNNIPEVKHELMVTEFGTNVKDWQKQLKLNGMGQVLSTYENIIIILKNNFNLGINEFTTECILKNAPWYKRGPQLEDADFAQFNAYFEKKWAIKGKTKIEDSIKIAARENAFHPVKMYLERLPKWDGIKRIESLLIEHMGAENTSYVMEVTKKFFAAAIQRIYNPGVKFDYVLTLLGPQGIGKSTLWSILASPEYFNDDLSLYDMKDKTGSEKLAGQWILEIAELSGMRKTETEVIKSFITRTTDKFRPAFGRVLETYPRQCVFVATSNEENGILRDVTGGRRFWIVEVKNKIDFDWIIANRDQIWAEAMTYKNEKLVLSPELEQVAEKIQNSQLEFDERESIIVEFMNKPIPPHWDDLSMDEKRYFDLNNPKDNWVPRRYISTKEIFVECFKKNVIDMTRLDSYKITTILKKLGYKQLKFLRLKGYGAVKVWYLPL